MSYPLPCQQSSNAALLRPIANWTLDTFGDDAPMLIGVEFSNPHVQFNPIYLDEEDPIDTLAGLVAPRTWDVMAVVVEAFDTFGRVSSGVVSHCVDREGRSATELDEWCGQRRSLRTFHGRLHDACVELFH